MIIRREWAMPSPATFCGWNSAGFGKVRGYVFEEILLVAHGGAHNDTIVTVERRMTSSQTKDAESVTQ